MWLEAILAKEDLLALLPQFAPVKVALADGGDFLIHDPSEISIVAGAGLRFLCKAKLHWPVLGIKLPITLNSVTVLIRPRVVKDDAGDQLVFGLEVEHADFAGLPGMIDMHITDKIIEALRAKPVELKWCFTSTLSHLFRLPPSLGQLEAIGVQATWGEVRVTEDAMVLAVSIRADVIRAPSGEPG